MRKCGGNNQTRSELQTHELQGYLVHVGVTRLAPPG